MVDTGYFHKERSDLTSRFANIGETFDRLVKQLQCRDNRELLRRKSNVTPRIGYSYAVSGINRNRLNRS